MGAKGLNNIKVNLLNLISTGSCLFSELVLEISKGKKLSIPITD